MKVAGVGLGLVLMAGTGGCGKNASDAAVVRVGQTSIVATTVRHWERTISLGARAQALDFLISRNWLIGEAARQGLAIPDSAVRRRMEQRLGALSNTRKVNRALAATGQTISDVAFEARAALAIVQLRKAIFSRIPAPTETEIASYNRLHHRTPFREEVRLVDLIEQLKSRSAAIALANRLGPGQRFAKQAMRETVARPTPQEEEHDLNGHLVHAIFAAPAQKMAGPVSYLGNWVIFVVRHTDREPPEVPQGLLRTRQQQALAAFVSRYRRRWRAETVCRAGFIVSRCSERVEDLGSETDPLSGA